jgi:hypothetical protein
MFCIGYWIFDHFNAQLVIPLNYSGIAIFHTLSKSLAQPAVSSLAIASWHGAAENTGSKRLSTVYRAIP